MSIDAIRGACTIISCSAAKGTVVGTGVGIGLLAFLHSEQDAMCCSAGTVYGIYKASVH
jgi:hypothetical protein